MKSMKMKKSAGPDEISQECLLIGINALVKPLNIIINASIKQGEVPDSWKEAVVIPILKRRCSSLSYSVKSHILLIDKSVYT